MFYVIGADAREYGPFTPDQVRDLVAQGRANAHSRVRRDGETAWQALKELPEFADLAAGPAPSDATAAPPLLTPEAIAAEYLARGRSLDIGRVFSRAWTLVIENPGLLVGASALVWLVALGLSLIPIAGLFAGIVINPVLSGGLCYVFLRRIRGETPAVGDAFDGFSIAFLQLALAGMVSSLLIAAGLLLCLLPGIYLAVGYAFAIPLVIDKRLEFWTAMEVSRRVVHNQWWTMFGLGIVAVLVLVAGVLACLVGVLLAAPVAIAAMMFAYEDLFGSV